MDNRTFKEWPTVLQRRCVLTGAAGAGFLLVGLVMYFTLHDRTLLLLSAMLATFTAMRCLSFYQCVHTGAYETVEGVCITLGRPGLRRMRSVRLLQYDGNEYALTLDRRTRLRIGNCYRVYFRQDDWGNGLLPEFLPMDQLLGMENLGEFNLEA